MAFLRNGAEGLLSTTARPPRRLARRKASSRDVLAEATGRNDGETRKDNFQGEHENKPKGIVTR